MRGYGVGRLVDLDLVPLEEFHEAVGSSFIGPRWRELYEIALAADYRFLSFGDAMIAERAS